MVLSIKMPENTKKLPSQYPGCTVTSSSKDWTIWLLSGLIQITKVKISLSSWHLLTCGQHCVSAVNVCTRPKGLKFNPHSSQCGYRILYQNLPELSWKTVLHKSTSYSSTAAVDLDDSQSFPLGSLLFQQWVISSAESEKRGREGGSFRVQGSLASSLSDSFPQAHDPSQPKTPAILCGSCVTVTLVTSVQFCDYESPILWDPIAACLCAWPEIFLFCISCGCVYVKTSRMTFLKIILCTSFYILLAISELFSSWRFERFVLSTRYFCLTGPKSEYCLVGIVTLFICVYRHVLTFLTTLKTNAF